MGENKVMDLEAKMSKLDWWKAEISGKCWGISEELQPHVQRIHQLEMRMWEWRKDLENDTREKISSLERHLSLQTTEQFAHATRHGLPESSVTCNGCADLAIRLTDLETKLGSMRLQVEAARLQNAVCDGCASLASRLTDLETVRSQNEGCASLADRLTNLEAAR